MADTVRDVIIIGGGLGAWSAAIYLGRNQRDSVLIELGTLDGGMGTDVQNYLGFPNRISGKRGRAPKL